MEMWCGIFAYCKQMPNENGAQEQEQSKRQKKKSEKFVDSATPF